MLNKRLTDRTFIAGEYSIADMACYPWIVIHERQQQNLEDFPHLKRWFLAIQSRLGVQRAYEKASEINTAPIARSLKYATILNKKFSYFRSHKYSSKQPWFF